MKNINKKRYLFLILGIFLTLLQGLLYAWSIFKTPLANEFLWTDNQLSLNFTLTYSFFCIGILVSGALIKRLSPRILFILAAIFGGSGFILSGLNQDNIFLFYFSYAFLAGNGIGFAYNATISVLGLWFPDKRGFCSGALMMSFGVSSLLLGNLAAYLFAIPSFGWRKVFILIGFAMIGFLLLAAFFLRTPNYKETEILVEGISKTDNVEIKNIPTSEAIRQKDFWLYYFYGFCMLGIGSAIISFLKDLSMVVGAQENLANLLVGVFSIFNGLGRIAFGMLFDKRGQAYSNLLSIIATLASLTMAIMAIYTHSLILLIPAIILSGLSYSSAPVLTSTFAASSYGPESYSLNFGLLTSGGIFSSISAVISSAIFLRFSSYIPVFLVLLGLALTALILSWLLFSNDFKTILKGAK